MGMNTGIDVVMGVGEGKRRRWCGLGSFIL